MYLTRARSSTWVFDTGSVANICNSKQGLAKGEMTICVGSVSKVDMIKHRMLPLPSRLVLNINNCYLVFALSIDMIGLCLSQYGYSFKENNGYSIFE